MDCEYTTQHCYYSAKNRGNILDILLSQPPIKLKGADTSKLTINAKLSCFALSSFSIVAVSIEFVMGIIMLSAKASAKVPMVKPKNDPVLSKLYIMFKATYAKNERNSGNLNLDNLIFGNIKIVLSSITIERIVLNIDKFSSAIFT